jgi:hypothetical protein
MPHRCSSARLWLYTLHNTNFLQAFFDGLACLDMLNTDVITDTAYQLDEKISEAHCAENHPVHVEVTEEMLMLHGMKALVDAAFETAKSFISESLAFINTFHNDEFDTIYCEREWRPVKAFDFDFKDIATIAASTCSSRWHASAITVPGPARPPSPA